MGLNAREFVDAFGWEEAERVATAAGTSKDYFAQLAGGHRRPSVDLAQRLVTESGDRLGLVELLTYRRPDKQRDVA
jgi:hypothetical protein